MGSGDTFLAQNASYLPVVGLVFFWEASYVFKEDACLLQSQEQRIFLFLVLLLIGSKTLGKSLALLEGQYPHW